MKKILVLLVVLAAFFLASLTPSFAAEKLVLFNDTVAVGPHATTRANEILGGEVEMPAILIHGPNNFYEQDGTVKKAFECQLRYDSKFWYGKKAKFFVNGAGAGYVTLPWSAATTKYRNTNTPGNVTAGRIFPAPGKYKVEVRVPLVGEYYFSRTQIFQVWPFDFYVGSVCRNSAAAVSVELRLEPKYGLVLEQGDAASIVIPEIAAVVETEVETGVSPWGYTNYRCKFDLTNEDYQKIQGSSSLEVRISKGAKIYESIASPWFSQFSDLSSCQGVVVVKGFLPGQQAAAGSDVLVGSFYLATTCGPDLRKTVLSLVVQTPDNQAGLSDLSIWDQNDGSTRLDPANFNWQLATCTTAYFNIRADVAPGMGGKDLLFFLKRVKVKDYWTGFVDELDTELIYHVYPR